MNLDKISQQYINKFPTDFSGNTRQRQTPDVLLSTVEPAEFSEYNLIHFNEDLSEEIGLGKLNNDENFLAAQQLPEAMQTYATAYAGHQFGNWAGQLGDGRAIFAGEIFHENKCTEIQWKGAGATPYSRHADGRAVLRSSLREYLMSEAMHHLGIPTTRALSLMLTGENIARDEMYNGNVKFEKGAVIIRTAESFLRFGHFELLSARNDEALLKKLADFCIENYFPEITSQGENKYIDWFQNISDRTVELLVNWLRAGFTHGVMNTDNMSILGLTIDYGPFSFLDEYQLNFTPNTTDLPGRRYSFGKQPNIAQWNLLQLANAIFPLIKDEEKLNDILNDFGKKFWRSYDEMMAKKFGFSELKDNDEDFFTKFQELTEKISIDYTIFFSLLSEFDTKNSNIEFFGSCFYYHLNKEQNDLFLNFMEEYKARISENSYSDDERKIIMERTNPKFILRNYLLYQCIEEVNSGKMELFNQIWEQLQNPYQIVYPHLIGKRPSEFDGVIGCSMLSCSS